MISSFNMDFYPDTRWSNDIDTNISVEVYVFPCYISEDDNIDLQRRNV